MFPDEVAALGVNEKAIDQLMFVASQELDTWNAQTGERMRSDESEVKRCMSRLKDMGVMNENMYAKAIEAYDEKTAAVDFADFAEQVNAIKGMNGPDEGIK